jgi:Flp pilus assembly protein TadG
MKKASSCDRHDCPATRGLKWAEGATKMKDWQQFIGGRIRAVFGKGEEGQTIVEFAFVVPVLLAVLLGIFQCGILFGNNIQLTNAIGAGAQYLQQIRTTSTDPCSDTFTAIKNAAPSLNPSSIGLHFTFTSSSGTQTTASGTSCSGDEADMGQGEPVTVTATYPAAMTIMGIRFLPSGFLLSQTITQYEY